MMTGLDFAVIALYFIVITYVGIKAGGRQTSTTDYFLGDRDLPWWAVCFSVVATETSTLTVIGIPAVAYSGTLTFFQITLGYLVGRILVSVIFLPRYFKGKLATAYAFLGERFGDRMRVSASATFLVTRLLADGVRLFATAIPIKVIANASGVEMSYAAIILLIGIVTIIYTLIGGIRAVIWVDAIQMLIYLGGAVLAMIVLLNRIPGGWLETAQQAGKLNVFDLGEPFTFTVLLTQPYVLLTAILGGALFTMASHGTDQLIVQRLLTCRTLGDSQKALIWSGVLVMIQFAIFLFVGLLLWSYYGGASPGELGLTRADEVFPKFLIEGLPPGVSGLIMAGILAAAMSTISSSLNSLASSTMFDLYERITKRVVAEAKALTISRGLTLFWGVIFMVFANLFEDTTNPVVELGLEIASFTYGGLLGAFLLGLLNKRSNQTDALIAFFITIAFLVWLKFAFWYSPTLGWVIDFAPTDAERAAAQLSSLAFLWYPVIGSILSICLGSLLALRHR